MKTTIECIVDGCFGIYVPQRFAELYDSLGDLQDRWRGVSDEDIEILKAGPEHEEYWFAWDELVNSAEYHEEGSEYCLWQDQDVFLMPVIRG